MNNYSKNYLMKKIIRRIRMKILLNPKQTILLSILFLCLIYIFCQIFSTPLINHDLYDHQLEHFTNANRCQRMNANTMKVFELFVKRIVNTFEMLEIRNFLCYETLWSALQRANEDKDKLSRLKLSNACFNLCVLNEDIIKHDELILFRRFRNMGITIQYIHSDGIYILRPTSKLISELKKTDQPTDNVNEADLHPTLFTIHARIHVFEKDSQLEMYRRIGWRSRILPSTMCKQLHCFPTSLVDGSDQLPKLEYLPSLLLNVPREGLELQKYHYPDTWWVMSADTSKTDDDCSD